MKNLVFILGILLVWCPGVGAVVLDWSGSYGVQGEFLQSSGPDGWDLYTFHSLTLSPDIRVFDGMHVMSAFQLIPNSEVSKPPLYPRSQYFYQRGAYFGFSSNEIYQHHFPVSIGVRNLYLEWLHDFGAWYVGWKPHHFGLGMHYHDSSDTFSPIYNNQGSYGSISWKGHVGDFYIQPIVHYLNEGWFNILIQAGFQKDQYGVEGIFQFPSIGAGQDNTQSQEPQMVQPPMRPQTQESQTPWYRYLGLYGYYKNDTLHARAEIAYLWNVYAGAMDIDWKSPWKRMHLGWNMGVSIFDAQSKGIFYFDPSFSVQNLSFLLMRYENFQARKTSAHSSLPVSSISSYTFHSGIYMTPSIMFEISKSWNLSSVHTLVISYPEMAVSLYGTDLLLDYQFPAGLVWRNGLGILLPQNGRSGLSPPDNFYLGAISSIAIQF